MYCTYSLNTLYTSDYVTNILHVLLRLFINHENSHSAPELNNIKKKKLEKYRLFKKYLFWFVLQKTSTYLYSTDTCHLFNIKLSMFEPFLKFHVSIPLPSLIKHCLKHGVIKGKQNSVQQLHKFSALLS